MDGDYKEFLLVNTVNGKAVSSLNDIVGIVGMPLGKDKEFFAVLFYFTELELQQNIKDEIDSAFNELFYSA